ncbi:MAG: Transcriptional regulator, GntR family [uncultured Caballeronia sp.]|nr:MAG: Transcriptional regulator, GntR family [uncultured Caballeronia sp.]
MLTGPFGELGESTPDVQGHNVGRKGKGVMDENKERSLVAKVMDGLVSGIVEQKYGAILPP